MDELKEQLKKLAISLINPARILIKLPAARQTFGELEAEIGEVSVYSARLLLILHFGCLAILTYFISITGAFALFLDIQKEASEIEPKTAAWPLGILVIGVFACCFIAWKLATALSQSKVENRAFHSFSLLWCSLATWVAAAISLLIYGFNEISIHTINSFINPTYNRIGVLLIIIIDLFLIAALTVNLVKFSSKKMKTLGIYQNTPNNNNSPIKLSAYIASMILISFIMTALLDTAFNKFISTHYQARGMAIQAAEYYPINAVIMACKNTAHHVSCGLTLQPRKHQDFIVFGDWNLRLEQSPDKSGTIPVAAYSSWTPMVTQGKDDFAIIKLQENEPFDLVINSTIQEACTMHKAHLQHASTNTGLFIMTTGRQNNMNKEESQPIRMVVKNEKVFFSHLQNNC